MFPTRPLRIALLGIGKIGRELVRRTLPYPHFTYVSISDTSGALLDPKGFSERDLEEIITLKEDGGKLVKMEERHNYSESLEGVTDICDYDVLVDVTDAQTYPLLFKSLEMSHVVVSNKKPMADVPFSAFKELISKSERLGRVLDFGVTVGGGMRALDLIGQLGAEGLERVEGCLSGTMNYLSQRINEGTPLSQSLNEAMGPPRYYTEPDPRVDLSGMDFARKLTIIARLCGRSVEPNDISVENVVSTELRHGSVKSFLEKLPSLDKEFANKAEKARERNRMLWYIGSADLRRDEYQVGFREVPFGDVFTGSRESDNVLKVYPRSWSRPVTVIGPGAGVPETVTGIIAGLRKTYRPLSRAAECARAHYKR